MRCRVRGKVTDQTAKKLAQHLRTANEELARAVQLAKHECSADEFEIWRQRLAAVIGALFLDALDPLYRERPSLAPDTLRDQYPLRRSD
jgi:hypothetical protein